MGGSTPHTGSGGGGTGAGRGVPHSASEYGHPVHFNTANLRYIHREGEYGGIKSANAVVITCGGRFNRGSDNGRDRSRIKVYV